MVEESAPASGAGAAPVPNEQPVQNPIGSLPLNVTIPPVDVKWVNALALGDYEIWLLVASLAFTAAAGFFVAFLQSGHTAHYMIAGRDLQLHERSDASLAVVAGIFVVLFIVFLGRGLLLRRLIWQNATTYKMTASGE
jgi:hypothetical protein